MQHVIVGVLAFVIGLAALWRWPRYRFAGALLAFGGLVAALRNHPARARLAAEQHRVELLCGGASQIVHEWSTPVSERYEYKFSADLLDELAFQSSQALVLHDMLGPILRRCVAVWTDDCDHWLDALAIPEDDESPFEVPPRRARTAAALQEALRTRACPKYTPMTVRGT